MSTVAPDEVNVLQLFPRRFDRIFGRVQKWPNVFSIAETFKNNPERSTFSLITHPKFPNAARLMAEP